MARALARRAVARGRWPTPWDWMSVSRPPSAGLRRRPPRCAAHRRTRSNARAPRDGRWRRARRCEERYPFVLQPRDSDPTKRSSANTATSFRVSTRAPSSPTRCAAHRRTHRSARGAGRRKVAMRMPAVNRAFSVRTPDSRTVASAYVPHRNACGERCDHGRARSSKTCRATWDGTPGGGTWHGKARLD